jgi:solute:Na+ symporter, SSS family
MNTTVFLLFLFGLQAICFIVGRRSSKGLNTQEDYFLAGKGIRFFPLLMTFLATQVGGGLVLGSAEEAYQFGWSVLFYPLGAGLGLIALGLGIGRKLAELPISTVAQIFEIIYRSPFLKKVASSLSIITLFMILVAQIVGSNKFITSLGVENPVWFIAFWGIVIAYTALGGLKAVVATDIIQAVFFIAVFLFAFGYAAYAIPAADIVEMSADNGHFIFDSSKLCGWLFMPLLFMVIEQDMGQRCFSAHSPNTVSKATLWAGICTLAIGIIPVFFGILAKNLGIEAPKGSSILMASVMQTTNPIIAAMAGCAILAAVISTADSLINAISSNLSQDFAFASSQEKNIRNSQLISAGIAIIGIFFSFYFNNIVDILILSYELSVSCLFIPIATALFRKKGHALSAGLAITFGAASFFLFTQFPPAYPKEILNVLFSGLGYLTGDAVIWMKARSLKIETAS